MKKLRIILPTFIIAVCCLFAACSTKSPQMIQLSAPSNLHKEFGFVVWDEVENAIGYVVYMEGKEYETEKCRYSLSSLTEPGEYVIEVLALGDWETYKDSDWSKFNYTVNEKVSLKPTANLAYTLLADKSGYEVSRGKADLNGTIVIPDKYNGLPVKKIAKRAYSLTALGGAFDPEKGIGCNTKTTNFILPETLEEIGESAFWACTNLEEVVIPESVNNIGQFAFAWDIKLKKIELPSALTKISSSVFGHCAFSEIDLPEALTAIGESVFLGCKNLSKITIPAGVTRLEDELFKGCESLAEINFPERIEHVGAFVFNDSAWLANHPEGYVTVNTVNGKVLVGYSGELPNGGVIDNIPSGVTHIATGVFTETDIVSITIPKGVTLGERTAMAKTCFLGCTSLQKVVFSEGITNIPIGAFYGCTALEDVRLPQSLKVIEASAFSGCKALKEIILPASIETVKVTALDVTTNLKIYYEGTKNDWIERKIGDRYLEYANTYFYAETEETVPADGGNYWHYIDGKPVIWTKE